MPQTYQYDTMSQREVLIVMAEKVEKIEAKLDKGDEEFHDHEHRLTQVETRCKTIHSSGNGRTGKVKNALLPTGLAGILIGIYEGIKAIVASN